jgi:hypothetical protein
MTKEFEIAREGELPVLPEHVWEGFTTGTAGWLWPMDFEPRVGGAAAFGGTVTVWDPPNHFVTRSEGPDGWFNQLEQVVEARPDGGSWWRYVHSGIFVEDWDNQYDGASKHTDFYLHTFRQYLQHFSGRPAIYAEAEGPVVSNTPDGFSVVRRAIGISTDTTQHDRVRLDVPGADPVDGVLDYLNPDFVGIRTDDAMYRFFGRNAFGAPVGISIHQFGTGVDQDKTQLAWQAWLDSLYA